jgi:hypothetical protein
MTPPRHLVSVWNPAYAVDAMDAHVSVLVDRARAHREGRLETEDDVHVWWGRIRSPRRQTQLPHLADILQLDDQLAKDVPTYLYLTDYSSLYVADLNTITVDNIREQEETAFPKYYGDQPCDLWFQIWDIRRLVADDTPGVIQELRKLHNVGYFDQPVSLYGGMTNLPLVVWRETEVDWFGDRAELTEGRLWAERDAEYRHEVARLSTDLRDNLFGERIWGLMEPATRTFLASAEAVVRARREDPTFDFSGPAVEYAKALETEVNAILLDYLRRALEDSPGSDRFVRTDKGEIDLGRSFGHQSLGTLRRLLTDEPKVGRALETVASAHRKFFTDPYRLPSVLEAAANLRNPAAHAAALGRDDLMRFRARLVGIGQLGALVDLVGRKRTPQ